MELVLRVTFSLLVVLGLIWFLARLARRSSGQRRRDTDAFSVLERRQLSRNASVAIVRVAGRALVLGVTDTHVSMLAETDLAELTKEAEAPVRRSPVPVQGVEPAPLEPTRIDLARADLDAGAAPRALTHVNGHRPKSLPAGRSQVRVRPLPADVPAQKQGKKDKQGKEQKPVKEQKPGKLNGSALSPQTWATAIEVLRARTVRK